jgi:hypothetical protein
MVIWIWIKETEGGIHKYQPTEQSVCDIYNRMGIFLALKNNQALPSVLE